MNVPHPSLHTLHRLPFRNVKSLSVACLALVGSACLFSTASAQTQIAGLMDDGRVVLADGDSNFSSSRTDIATFNDNSGANPFVDVTFGGGLIYGLRDDGAVFSTDLSGNVNTVSTTGWGSVSRIDYANGELFGMAVGTNATILDTGGTTRVNVANYTAVDFASCDAHFLGFWKWNDEFIHVYLCRRLFRQHGGLRDGRIHEFFQ